MSLEAILLLVLILELPAVMFFYGRKALHAIREEVVDEWTRVPDFIAEKPMCGHDALFARHVTGATACEACVAKHAGAKS